MLKLLRWFLVGVVMMLLSACGGGSGDADNIDKIKPTITIIGDNPYYLKLNNEFDDPGASVVDNKDSSLELITSKSIDTTTVGKYTISYTAVDSSGNKAIADRIVEVIDIKSASDQFTITDLDKNLTLSGVTETSSGDTGTTGGLTDVIASKKITYIEAGEEKETHQIVYRSFNIGEWKGIVTQETTVLARIFIQPELISISNKTKIALVKYLKENYLDLYNEALKYQELSIKSNFFTDDYYDIIASIQSILIKKYSQIIKKRGNNTTIPKMVKYINSDTSFTDMSLMQLKSSEDSIEFSNYANIYYGVRLYKQDGTKIDFNYPMFSTKNFIIDPVKGGAAGGLYDYLTNKIPFAYKPTTKLKYNDLFDIESDIKSDQESLMEIYKWQWGYPTLLNGTNGISLIIKTLGMGAAGKKVMESVKDKFEAIQKKLDSAENIVYGIDAAFTVVESTIDLIEYIEPDSKKEFKPYRKLYDDGKRVIKKFYSLAKTKPYSPNTKNFGEIFQLKQLLGSIAPVVPTNIETEALRVKLQKSLDNIQDKKKQFKVIAAALFMNKILKPLIKSSVEGRKAIKDFNTKYKSKITFSQMSYYIALKRYGKLTDDANLRGALIVYSKNFLNKKILKSMKKSLGKYLNTISSVTKSINVVKSMVSKTIKVVDQDILESVKNIATFLINTKVLDLKAIAGEGILSLIKRANPAGAAVQGVQAINDWSSYLVGNFVISNKQYFKVSLKDGAIDISMPPVTFAGVSTKGAIKPYKSSGRYTIGDKRFLVTADADYDAKHIPQFDMFFLENNKDGIIIDGDLEDLLETPEYRGKTIFTFDLNIEKSKDDTEKLESFASFGAIANRVRNISIKSDDIVTADLSTGEHGMSYLDIMEAWKVHANEDIYVTDKTRGLFSESVTVEMASSDDSHFIVDKSIKQHSLIYYAYKVADEKLLNSSIELYLGEKDGEKNSIYVKNNADFSICYDIKYDYKSGYVYDDRKSIFGSCIDTGNIGNFDLTPYTDDNGILNDVELIFYDKLAQQYFEKENIYPTSNKGYIDSFLENHSINKLTYNVSIDDIVDVQYFSLTDKNIGGAIEFLPMDDIILQFDNDIESTGNEFIPIPVIKDKIYFLDTKTGKKIDITQVYYGVKNCKLEKVILNSNEKLRSLGGEAESKSTGIETTRGESIQTTHGGVTCEEDYSTLKIKPVMNTNTYKLVIDNTLQSSNGNFLDKKYEYDINTYHPNKLEIVDSSIDINKNSANINLNIFAKYNTKTLSYKVTTSSGIEQSGSFKVGYNPDVGGCPGSFGGCSVSLNICPSMSVYEENIVNYSHINIGIDNSTNSSISDSISIEVCDGDSCENESFTVSLSGVNGDCDDSHVTPDTDQVDQ